MPGMLETVLAFDFGLRRIGVAIGQQVTRSATPLPAVANGDSGPDWTGIERLINEWRPARIIVGMPSHADGSPADMGDRVNEFIDKLARFERPVETVDERYTSLEAQELLRDARARGRPGRIDKGMIDSVAAVLIAERWLNGH